MKKIKYQYITMKEIKEKKSVDKKMSLKYIT